MTDNGTKYFYTIMLDDVIIEDNQTEFDTSELAIKEAKDMIMYYSKEYKISVNKFEIVLDKICMPF